MEAPKNEEMRRLQEAREKQVSWRKWGPYLSERQWGSVREGGPSRIGLRHPAGR